MNLGTEAWFRLNSTSYKRHYEGDGKFNQTFVSQRTHGDLKIEKVINNGTVGTKSLLEQK